VCDAAPYTICKRTYFGNTTVGMDDWIIPTETPILDISHVIVYTLSSLVEQSTPEAHLIFDEAASVSAIAFTDDDIDATDLGGLVSWVEPVYSGRVEAYRMYMATSVAGKERSQIWHEVTEGTNELAIPAETPLLSYANLVVYTQSSLAEQSTPVSFNISDAISFVTNITFPDFDLDKTDLGGELAWEPPAQDIDMINYYHVYFAEDAQGANRWHFQNVSNGINNITVPVEFALLSYTHIVVYTMSTVEIAQQHGVRTSLLEQTTPTSHLIFDAFASVSDVTFTGKDLDIHDLGGLVEWHEPPATERVDQYRVYFSLSYVGGNRSQIEDPLPIGTNVVLVPAETPRADWLFAVVYTQSSLVEQTTPVGLPFFRHTV
jgi:hypothetical protein